MAFEDVMKQVAETFEKEGNSRAVFGEPIKLETKTVIPVATVQLAGGGGGMGPAGTKASSVARALLGGGGGGGLNVTPVGFIHERDGVVVFTPIHVDVKGRPLLTEASNGLGKAIDAITMAVSAFTNRRGLERRLHTKPTARA